MRDFVGDQPGDQTDAEFQDKRFGGVDHIDRVKEIADGHADGAAESPVHAAKQQRAQHTDRVPQMDRGGVTAGQGNFDLQKSEHHIGQCGKDAGKYNL